MKSELRRQRLAVHLAEGNELQKKGMWHKAAVCFTEGLECCPSDVSTLLSRSKCFVLMGKLAEALADAEEVIQVERNSKTKPSTANPVRGILQKAETLYAMGSFEESLLSYHDGLMARSDIKGFKDGIKKAESAIYEAIGAPEMPKLQHHKNFRILLGRASIPIPVLSGVGNNVLSTNSTCQNVDLFGETAGLSIPEKIQLNSSTQPDQQNKDFIDGDNDDSRLEDVLLDFKSDVLLLRELTSSHIFSNESNLNNVIDTYTTLNKNNHPGNKYINTSKRYIKKRQTATAVHLVGPSARIVSRARSSREPATETSFLPVFGRLSALRAATREAKRQARLPLLPVGRKKCRTSLFKSCGGKKRISLFRKRKTGLYSGTANSKMRLLVVDALSYLQSRKRFWMQNNRFHSKENLTSAPQNYLKQNCRRTPVCPPCTSQNHYLSDTTNSINRRNEVEQFLDSRNQRVEIKKKLTTVLQFDAEKIRRASQATNPDFERDAEYIVGSEFISKSDANISQVHRRLSEAASGATHYMRHMASEHNKSFQRSNSERDTDIPLSTAASKIDKQMRRYCHHRQSRQRLSMCHPSEDDVVDEHVISSRRKSIRLVKQSTPLVSLQQSNDLIKKRAITPDHCVVDYILSRGATPEPEVHGSYFVDEISKTMCESHRPCSSTPGLTTSSLSRSRNSIISPVESTSYYRKCSSDRMKRESISRPSSAPPDKTTNTEWSSRSTHLNLMLPNGMGGPQVSYRNYKPQSPDVKRPSTAGARRSAAFLSFKSNPDDGGGVGTKTSPLGGYEFPISPESGLLSADDEVNKTLKKKRRTVISRERTRPSSAIGNRTGKAPRPPRLPPRANTSLGVRNFQMGRSSSTQSSDSEDDGDDDWVPPSLRRTEYKNVDHNTLTLDSRKFVKLRSLKRQSETPTTHQHSGYWKKELKDSEDDNEIDNERLQYRKSVTSLEGTNTEYVVSNLASIHSCLESSDMHAAIRLATDLLTQLDNLIVPQSHRVAIDLYELLATCHMHTKQYTVARQYFTKQLITSKKYNYNVGYKKAVAHLAKTFKIGGLEVLKTNTPVDLCEGFLPRNQSIETSLLRFK